MTYYRKKPILIEAVQFDGTLTSLDGFGVPEFSQDLESNDLQIATLAGVMTARPGDWIIKGVKGEFYPCKPEIFDATYELATASVADLSSDASPNAHWLTLAHMICTDLGIPHGHIMDRLRALQERLSATSLSPKKPRSADAAQKPREPDRAPSDVAMAAYDVAKRFGVYEAQAFELADAMWVVMRGALTNADHQERTKESD
jgi:hypothetical protein